MPYIQPHAINYVLTLNRVVIEFHRAFSAEFIVAQDVIGTSQGVYDLISQGNVDIQHKDSFDISRMESSMISVELSVHPYTNNIEISTTTCSHSSLLFYMSDLIGLVFNSCSGSKYGDLVSLVDQIILS